MTQNKTFKLKFSSRFALLSLLPEKGDFNEMIVKEDLRRKLLPSKKELARFQLRIDPQTGTLNGSNDAMDYLRQYQFSELETNLIVKQLKQLNERKELHDNMVDLYRWFVNGEPCEYRSLEPEEPAELADYTTPEPEKKP